jgi:predicted transcriptional regulator
MATEKQGITVRFDEDEMQELGSLADRYRVSSATILRWALRALGNHVERNEGRLVLPLDFGEAAVEKSAKKPVKRTTAAGRAEAPSGKPAKKRGR